MLGRCAVGASFEARYHPGLVTYPRPLAEFFAQRAKVLLELELDSPAVSTVQALLLLSSHELGFERTARSWLYGGEQFVQPYCGTTQALTTRKSRHGNEALL